MKLYGKMESRKSKKRLYYNCLDWKYWLPYVLITLFTLFGIGVIGILKNNDLVLLGSLAMMAFLLYAFISVHLSKKHIVIVYSDRITWYRLPRPTNKQLRKSFTFQGKKYKSYYCCLFFSQVEYIGIETQPDSQPMVFFKAKNGEMYVLPDIYLNQYSGFIEAINASPYNFPVHLNPLTKMGFVDLTDMPIDEIKKHLRKNCIPS